MIIDDENNGIDATQHNLRPRNTLQPPSRYASEEQLQNQANVTKIKLLKRKRAGKKGLITKKISQIKTLINERGSRTKIQFLNANLMDCKRETTDIHEDLMELLEETDESFGDQWIEEITYDIDDCSSDINDYLISRRDDLPSDTMSKTALVGEYLKESITNDNPGEGLSNLEKQMNNLSINKNVNERSELSPHAVSFQSQKWQSHETNPKLVIDEKTTEYFRIPNETKIHASVPNISKVSWDNQYHESMSNHNSYEQLLYPQNMIREKSNKGNPTNMIGQSYTNLLDKTEINQNDMYKTGKQTLEELEMSNEVDSWIDLLNLDEVEVKPEIQQMLNSEMSMTWFIQQSLPRMKVPKFDGSPIKWVDFITKFKELVNDHPYLNNSQKFIYLIQHVEGEAKRALKVFSSSRSGYILALKRLKYMFGQRKYT